MQGKKATPRYGQCRALLLLALVGLAAPPGSAEEQRWPPLNTDPVEAVVRDLETYIPRRMQEANVLGLSVCLVRNDRIVWARGFGVANSLTRQPVMPETAFSVASNGKAISAYAALTLADQGKLVLDEPLRAKVKTAFLAATPGHDSITLRQLLSHTSGLSNQLNDQPRELSFRPGERFSYSGVGFMYLQEVLESASGASLDEVASQTVFRPLRMERSSFVAIPEAPPEARGHIGAGYVVVPFGLLFVPSMALLCGVLLLVARVRTGRWRLGRRALAAATFVAVGGAIFYLRSLSGDMTIPVFFTGVFLACVALWVVLWWLGARLVVRRLPTARTWRIAAHAVCGITSLLLLALALRSIRIPVPDWFPAKGNAAWSLRSTAPDLARFLIALADENNGVARKMAVPQVRVNEHVSWGLGIGIQHSDQGDALWHWGINPGSKSLMVIYPSRKTGIVVLTNSENGSVIMSDIAARALGGKAAWDTSPRKP